jgi:RNA recognition motif-containing protein
VQFRYREVAEIVAETMNGYMLMGKVLVSNVLKPNMKNPFSFGNSREYKFINWKRIFMHQVNKEKTPEEIKKYVSGLLKN